MTIPNQVIPGVLRAKSCSLVRDPPARRDRPPRVPLIGKDEQTDEGGIVLYPVGPSGPRSFRRRNRAVFVVGIGEAETYPEEPLKAGYPMLLRTLANLFIMICEKGRRAARRPTSSRLSRATTRFPTRAIRRSSSRKSSTDWCRWRPRS